MLRRLVPLVLVAGCTASAAEVSPKPDAIFFPTGVAVSPDESHLFVINANSQLEFDSGTVGVVPLDAVDNAVAGWLTSKTIPANCQQDATLSEVLDCPASMFLDVNAGVRIGNFAANIGVQDKGGGDLRLVIPVRGDPSITYVDWDHTTNTLSCGDAQGFPLCDDAHRLTHFLDDTSLPALDPEPYGVFVDSPNQFAIVTHLSAGTATLVDLAGTPQIADSLQGLFQVDYTGLRVGSVGVAGRTPGSPDDIVYVTSNTENRVQTMTVARPDPGPPLLVPSDFFFLDQVGGGAHASADTRAVAFDSTGDVGYFMNRLPPTLTLVDTSLDQDGFPNNTVLGATDICRQSVSLAVTDAGAGDRAYLTCFQEGTMYVVDPRQGVQVAAISPIGRGPFGIAAAPGRQRLYVTSFYDDTIGVVDLTPGSPTENRVVLRIGIPTAQAAN